MFLQNRYFEKKFSINWKAPLTQLTKSFSKLLGLTAAVSTAEPAIHKKFLTEEQKHE